MIEPQVPTLRPALGDLEKQFLSSMPPEIVQRLKDTGAKFSASFRGRPLSEGDKAPDFTLLNATGQSITLREMLTSHKAVILTWYRGGWCPYCNLTLRTLMQANKKFNELDAKLVALSPETPDESVSTSNANDLQFEVLSDIGLKVAEEFGIAFTVPDDILSLYDDVGLRIRSKNGNTEDSKPRLPLPATFVLNQDAEIVYSFANVDYTKRAEPKDIISAINAIE